MALTMDLEDVAEYRLSFETLQSLRHLSDKVPPLVAILQASITTIERIGHSYTSSCQSHGPHRFQLEDVNRLSSYSHQLQGYLKSAEILQTRIQGILNLVSISVLIDDTIHLLNLRLSLQMH